MCIRFGSSNLAARSRIHSIQTFGWQDMSAPRQVQMDSIDETKVVVHSACCCCYDGCIPEFNNIGCAAQETLLCLEADVCCKTNTPCLCCGCCAIRCIPITTCCKAQSQFFCCVAGSALPPDGEVPCMFNVCFLNLFPKIGCCMKLGELKG
ncbi:unnamed protein product [Durusdinium trenchii]|uniref:Uncharacterized protein n=2 Tax=Durusdinium trenchii TaxID=1381693 RepID=A0ABP0M8P4_9DINO